MIEFTALTDVGSRHKVNEDAIGWSEEQGLWFVADGMGGHVGGQRASQIVKDTLINSDIENLQERVLSAHDAIRAAAAEEVELVGMGSTVVAVQIRDKQCKLVWVGDSRAYLWRNNELRQLSRDHSLVQSLLDIGEIDAEQADDFPQKNVITQSLGVEQPKPGVEVEWLVHDDWLLLCSDGLSGELTDEEITQYLRRAKGLNETGKQLLAAALQRGGRDNISLVLMHYRNTSTTHWRNVGIALATGAFVALLCWQFLS